MIHPLHQVRPARALPIQFYDSFKAMAFLDRLVRSLFFWTTEKVL